MKINRIVLHNFRIYKEKNEINFEPDNSKNISIIAGKNGFGKTTFLTALIWVFYGKMMGEVEDKYRKDIKSLGGYDKFLKTLLNRDIKTAFESKSESFSKVSVTIELSDLAIPSMPCKSVIVTRTYDLRTETESLDILIDGVESELSREVGNEVFINDFILPREIAKFFFFDAEKIVSLAEAKSKQELRNLSRAYSEVLGIKKYEDLKKNLETLLSKLKREGASETEKTVLETLLSKERELQGLIDMNLESQNNLERDLAAQKAISDGLQEKLIREGNGMTLEELKELKKERDNLKHESDLIRNRLKKLLDIVPVVLAGKKLIELRQQLLKENELHAENINKFIKTEEFASFSNLLLSNLSDLDFDKPTKSKIVDALKKTISEKQTCSLDGDVKVLLDFNDAQYLNFDALFNNIKTTFSSQFEEIVRLEKNNKVSLSRIINKIKQAEARNDNHLAQKIREEKEEIDAKISALLKKRDELIGNASIYNKDLATNHKSLSEIEKKIKLDEEDVKKYEVIEKLLVKINRIIRDIKEDKKYSLQKSLLLGLKRMMHKDDFIANVRVNVSQDVMDIDLLDKKDHIIDKDSLSKGEQQLYASALLKALVDESGIKFPVFIDSPLQKFDKYHSKNIIKEFYPDISEQVVLFPLLEKELSEAEYEYIKPNVNKVFIIENNDGSTFKGVAVDALFNHLKEDSHVYAN